MSRLSTRMSIDQGSFKEIKPPATTLNKLRHFIGASFFGKANNKAIESQPASIPEIQIEQPTQTISFFQTNNHMTNLEIISNPCSGYQGAYVPELSRNQYVIRQDKLNDIQRFVVKDSTTQVIVI